MTQVLDIKNLYVDFPLRTAWGRVHARVQAVRGVDIVIEKGQTVGLVGESGCGKSTLAKAIVRLVDPAQGHILVDGEDWAKKTQHQLRPFRPQVQMVFQDPYSSLNPRMRIGTILEEPLLIHRRGTSIERKNSVAALLEQVGLHPDDIDKYPHEFSGGQRQRIGIARAVILSPDLLVADEAVSALDVSIQAQILNLLLDLQDNHGHSMLFISHDLRVVEHIADQVYVMYLGKIVESGPPQDVFVHPRHPYTRALLDSVPTLDTRQSPEQESLAGEPPSPSAPPSGCAFRTRCLYATPECEAVEPLLMGDGHRFACHHPVDGKL